jgi:FLVCR family MFS transporter 7
MRYSIWTIHIAQILNAAVGPFVMATPSKISANWFPPKERTTATAIGTLSNYMGSAAGFLIGPYVVSFSNIQTLIVVEAIHGLVILIWTCLYFPDKPPSPPSASAGK